MSSKYKIINTTIKPPRPHPKTGDDLRTAVEKVGHNVKLRLGPTEEVIVERHRPRIIDKLDEGTLRAQRAGFIRIEEVGDMTEIFKKHTLSAGADATKELFTPDVNAPQNVDNAHRSKDRREAKVTEMGKDTHTQDSGKEEEGAVNPDGDPNFLVKADKSLSRKPRINREEAPVEPTKE